MGRPRLKGKRLPNLEKVLVNPNTQWEKITLNRWYGEGERTVEIYTGVAVWYHTGLPVVPIRWVLVRDPLGKFEPQAILMYSARILAKANLRVVCASLAS